jgi:hypothetical protein
MLSVFDTNTRTGSNPSLITHGMPARLPPWLTLPTKIWFGSMTITLEDGGATLLTGPVVDQAALPGLLRRVHDLGLPLISVTSGEFERTEVAEGEP